MRRWGMEYSRLRQLKPDLIMLSSSLNGQTGPQASLAGFGTMGAQLAGFGAITGWPDRPPAGPFVAYSDYTAPKFVAASILAALRHRRVTGEGQHIDLSQVESAIHFLAPAMLDFTTNGHVLERRGNRSDRAAPHGVYPCRGEDAWVAIVCDTEVQWDSLCGAVQEFTWSDAPERASLDERLRHVEQIDADLAAWTSQRSAQEIEERLQAVGVPVHRVSTPADAFADPQLQHRRHFACGGPPRAWACAAGDAALSALIVVTGPTATRPNVWPG